MLKATLAGAALLLAAATAGRAAVAAGDIPATPEPGTFRLGLEPWLGYGQWRVAEAGGVFGRRGLEGVELVNFAEDKDINAALASGALDGANIATHTAMAMAAAGLPIRIVMLEDVSMGADAIIARGGDVAGVADLKGRRVAFEQGTTSDILLNYALQSEGMTVADVEPVPMPAADAGGALIAGRVPVAVTYEPYLTAARNQDKDVKVLFTAGENPGLVSDVLVVREEVLAERPGQVLALVRSWDEALSLYRADTKGGQAVIAQSVGSSLGELAAAFAGVRYYSLADNATALEGEFAKKTFADVGQAARKAGLIEKEVPAASLIDGRFVAAAAAAAR